MPFEIVLSFTWQRVMYACHTATLTKMYDASLAAHSFSLPGLLTVSQIPSFSAF